MAQISPEGAEAFETDFWKDANLRKAWDDIIPGEPRKTLPYTLTRGDRAVLQIGRRGSPNLLRRGLCQDHPLSRADRAALDPYPLDVLLHAGGRLDALAGHSQCRPVIELQHSGAAE